MKLCSDVVTVFNKKLNAVEGWDEYIPTTIQDVSWYCEIASAVDDKGLHASNRFTIRIPVEADSGRKAYVDPIAFANAEDVSKYWTLASGDIIVKGTVEGNNLTPAQLHASYPDCCTILGVTDNRRAPNAPHFKVVGS